MKQRLFAIIIMMLVPFLLFSQENQKSNLPNTFLLTNSALLMESSVIGFAHKNNNNKLNLIQSNLKPYSFNAIKGEIGESLTDSSYFKRLGENWVQLTPRNGTPQGLDHAYIKFSNKGPVNLLIADSKFTNQPFSSSLGKTKDGQQLSLSWIKPRVETSIINDYSSIRDLDASGKIEVKMYTASSVSDKSRPIQKDAFYWRDANNGKWYYSGADLDSKARIKKLDTVDQFLNGCIDGKIQFSQRGIQYRIENKQLVEKVYDVGDSPKLIETRIISNNSEVTALLHSNDSWNAITNKYGVSNVKPKHFSNEEIMELITLKTSNSNSIKNSKVVNKLNSISSRNTVLKSYGKSALVLAGVMITLDIISQSIENRPENIDIKQLITKGQQGAIISIGGNLSNQVARKITKAIPIEDFASKFIKVGIKQTTKKHQFLL